MENTTVDVQRIMEEIKEEIASKGLVNDIPSFEDVVPLYSGTPVDLAALKHELAYLKQYEVHYYRDITSYHRWLTPLVRFVKRVIRKLCKFLGEPMVDEINEYHNHMAGLIEQIIAALERKSTADDTMLQVSEAQILAQRKVKRMVDRYEAQFDSFVEPFTHLKELQETVDKLQKESEKLKLELEILQLKVEKSKE